MPAEGPTRGEVLHLRENIDHADDISGSDRLLIEDARDDSVGTVNPFRSGEYSSIGSSLGKLPSSTDTGGGDTVGLPDFIPSGGELDSPWCTASSIGEGEDDSLRTCLLKVS